MIDPERNILPGKGDQERTKAEKCQDFVLKRHRRAERGFGQKINLG